MTPELNNYWLTAHTYKYALSFFSPIHPFKKILLENGDGSVASLFEEGVAERQ